ncbi:hypothetical protein O181_042979 [Austropuccinia psidii MF-1]|uniref:Uncharacterized protein n=1 Tax=Austropuccinia psidii MF-1 TaxID=1389203 RepID=A0A9Q3DHE9_9BASI|nr:hypothetical protein [Austropuccinia psidii MF-1]
MRQMQDVFLNQGKKKGKMIQSTLFTPGASPSELTLQRHVGPEESPSSPTPGPRETSNTETEQRAQTHQSSAFFSTPTNSSPLQQQIPRQERHVVEIKAKDYNLNLNEVEVETFLRKVERIAQIEGAIEDNLVMQITVDN